MAWVLQSVRGAFGGDDAVCDGMCGLVKLLRTDLNSRVAWWTGVRWVGRGFDAAVLTVKP